MEKLLDVFAFLTVIMRGLTLSFQSLLVGGIAFQLLLRHRPPPDFEVIAQPISKLMRLVALALALIQLLFVSANVLILSDTAELGLREVAGADFVIAGLGSVLCSIVLIIYLAKPQRPITTQFGLVFTIVLASLATSHSWSRIDLRAVSTGFTFLHQLAAGIWIGALPYLLIAVRCIPDRGQLVPIVRAFSSMAMTGVAIILVAGGSLSLIYLDSPSAFYGTSYGAMVGSKIWLMAGILSIGAANFFIVRKLSSNATAGFGRLQRFIEAEIGIGFTVILAAASLVSQPPAIDLVSGRVTTQDLVQRFTPHVPGLQTPSINELSPSTQQVLKEKAARSGMSSSYVPGVQPEQPSTPGDIAWSEYNHHWAGVIVILIGLLAVASRTGKAKWARHWPLLFLGLALFLFLRADPENWPLGPNGFWESFLVADVLQHRFFTLLIIGFAIFEWRVQNGRTNSAWAPYVFPAICAVAGAVLLTHSHSLTNIKEATLIELSHIPLAVFAVFAGWSRWLELRMDPGNRKVLSWIWPICFVMIGSALLFYREA